MDKTKNNTKGAPVASQKAVETIPSSPEEKSTKVAMPLIEALPGGTLVPTSLEDQYRLARYYHNSGLMPRGLDTPEKVLVALQMCFEHGLPPMSSIGKIAVINGTPSMFGDLPLALVHKSGKLKQHKEWWFGKDGNPVADNAPIEQIAGASCTTQRHGMEPLTRSFTIADATLAQLWGKKGQSGNPTPWVLYPKRMLQMRARSWALKDGFGDVLMGISIMEYDHNAFIDESGKLVAEHSSRPVKDISQELNDTYLKKEAHQEPEGAR